MAKQTSAGQLREHVAWDARALTSDGYGNTEGGFDQVFTCRAGYTPLRGGEAVLASRLEGRQPIVVRVRRSSETEQIEADWRMRDLNNGAWTDSSEEVWSGPVYAVKSIAATPDHRFLDVLVESGVAA